MKEDMSHVRTAVYLIETDNSKQVQKEKLGGRKIIDLGGDGYKVDIRSVYDKDPYNLCDGHINRNIRAALAMIDMSKPYVVVDSIQRVGDTDSVEVLFRVNGCVNLDQVSLTINDQTQTILTNGKCNQLLA